MDTSGNSATGRSSDKEILTNTPHEGKNDEENTGDYLNHDGKCAID